MMECTPESGGCHSVCTLWCVPLYINTAEGKFLVIRTKVLRVFLYYRDFTHPSPPLSKSGLKLVCNVNILYGNLMFEISQDYAQKPQGNCTFMNSASVKGFHGSYSIVKDCTK